VNFYRTTFDLNIPDGIDMPVRLSITPSAMTSNFRMQIYLNGWQIGKYINNIGYAMAHNLVMTAVLLTPQFRPQTLFVLPAGYVSGHVSVMIKDTD